jgi:outer membrane protein, heavy metal efflux system
MILAAGLLPDAPGMLPSLTLVVALLSSRAAEPPALQLSALPDRATLAALLWEGAPRLAPFRTRVAEAEGERVRAGLLPNPTLDASWNTIPVGPTNPSGLDRPVANVPNYAFGLSELVELGKRGPRRRAASALTASAREDARAALFDAYFDVSDKIAGVATAELRMAALVELAEDARKLTEIQRARAQRGDAAQLDVDRAALEEEKLRASVAEERAKIGAGLRECAEILGSSCQPFGSRSAAQDYLAQRPAASAALEERPDLRSLEHQAAAAEATLDLARSRAIPDPTLRVGYVYDRFLAAGNQGNSVFVGVSVPLTFFDHGQADVRIAAAALANAQRSRAVLLDLARAQSERVLEQGAAVEERRRRLRDVSLPLAQSVVKRLEEAVRRGGAPLPDLLLARRTLGELAAEAADLDLSAFLLASAEARLRGEGPPVPAELRGSS